MLNYYRYHLNDDYYVVYHSTDIKNTTLLCVRDCIKPKVFYSTPTISGDHIEGMLKVFNEDGIRSCIKYYNMICETYHQTWNLNTEQYKIFLQKIDLVERKNLRNEVIKTLENKPITKKKRM